MLKKKKTTKSFEFPCCFLLENLTSIEKVLKSSSVDLISFGLTFEEIESLKSSVSVYVQKGDYLTG